MLKYKIDVLQELKNHGYNTYVLKKNRLLPETTIQKIRTGTMVGIKGINEICRLLNCQPGDLMVYVPDDAD